MKIFPLEFSSFESLFKNKRLVIPYYQRDYIWKKSNWENWLRDIKKLVECEDVEEIHFIGNIISQKSSETNPSLPDYLIIDGQQRITTFFIFCFVVLEILDKNNSKNNVLIEKINQLLFTPQNMSRLAMRGENESSLESIIRHKNFENNEERVFEACDFFRKKLGTGMAEKHLKDWFEKLKDGFKFISIQLDDKDDALKVFKSINDSGVMLTSTDLIKAEFFVVYERKGLGWEKLANDWENIIKRIDKENINHFFYTFLCTRFKKTNEYSEKEFYVFFKEKLLEPAAKKGEIENLWNEVVEQSKIYEQILKPQQEYWGEYFYLPILETKILNTNQMFPFIISLKEKKLTKEKESIIFQKLIIYHFRKITKGEKFQKSDVMKWANLIRDGHQELILNDKNIIREIEKSSIFWDELEQKNLKENEIRWLLTKFYLTLLPEGTFLSPSLQLEHMFPKNPNKEWWNILEWRNLKENEKEIKEKRSSLGNITLLTQNKNIVASNKVWKEKSEEFKQKTFLKHEKLNLLKKPVLLPKDIDKRKKWLVQQFKRTGILFIDEKKEKSQIEEDSED